MSEEWRDVVGYEGLYQVSNIGRVRSCDRIACDGRRLKGKLRKLHSVKDGYLAVILYRDAKPKLMQVHRLVCEAFLENPESKPLVNHKDGVVTNNYLDNLEWVTASENIIHALQTGLFVPKAGEGHAQCRLSFAEVQRIRSMHEDGMNGMEISKAMGVSFSYIYRILRNERRVSA